MKLSVIMPAYNCQETICQAVDSILNQTFGDFEFIIINDGSTDKTTGLLESYLKNDKRIVLINQENRGVTKSLNRALWVSRGDFIARQDADDISSVDRLQKQLTFLKDNPDIGFAGCSCEIIDKDNKFLNLVYIKNDPKNINFVLRKNNIFCHGSMMFRRNVLEKSGGYREFFRYAQDYDLYLRLIEFSSAGSAETVLYKRRELLGNISIEKFSLQQAFALLAQRCYEKRLSDRDDSFLLNEGSLQISASDYTLPYMKSLYYVKENNIPEARRIINNFIRPLKKEKYKFCLLLVLTYMPRFIRNCVFYALTRRRKARMMEYLSKI